MSPSRPIGRAIGRAKSFVIILAVYLLAVAVGVLAYVLLPGAVWLRLLLANVSATLVTFVFSLVFRNASVYDPYWSVQPPVILLLVMIGRGTVLSLPHILLFSAVMLWAVRLTANWAYTFGGLSHQDWRYTMLAETTGRLYPLVNLFGIHLVPTLVVHACLLPAVSICLSNRLTFAPLSLIAFALCLGAVALQTVSDIQMHAYRHHRTTPFIEVGLWKYSRHPNYLGEILMWWGVALFAVLTLGFHWYFILGALLNTALFLFISIPMADRRQARKEGFAAYRARTCMLLPLPRR